MLHIHRIDPFGKDSIQTIEQFSKGPDTQILSCDWTNYCYVTLYMSETSW